jgi:KaiC/GvpD/RAD55 family RecA-like ATPase
MADGAGFTIENAGFRPLTAAELLNMEIPPRRTLLTPWLPEKGAAMIYAPRGLGKTYLSLSVAYAVASRGGVLRWQAPEARPVLFVDGEMPLVALQERIAGIASASEARPPQDDFLRFLPADLFRDGLPDLASQQGRELIERLANGVALVVLDNLSSLASGRENEGDDWRPMQDLVLSLRRRGTSTLLVHHSGKGGQQRGTSRREDVLDTVIALRRPEDYEPTQGARFEVHFEKARGFTGSDAAPFEATLRVTANGALGWDACDVKQDAKAAAFVMFSGGSKPEMVAATLSVNRATAYRWQKEWKGVLGG